jgi:hypothetical protein
VLETRTAGDPDDVTLVFTDLSPPRLSATMTKMGTPVCAEVIRHWMEEQDLRSRKIAQDLAGGHSVVYLSPAAKYPRLTRRLSQGQKGLDERAIMASQRLSDPW